MSSHYNTTSTGGNAQYSYTSSSSPATPAPVKPVVHNQTVVAYDTGSTSSTGNINLLKLGVLFCAAAAVYMYTCPVGNNGSAQEATSKGTGIIERVFGGGNSLDTTLVPQVADMNQWERSEHDTRMAYIRKYKHVAMSEQKAFGILASITLAQGILESGAGTSKLVQATNNHFGMKCFSRSCKKGHCKNFTDDTHKDFFLCFDGAWASYRAHSKLLTNGNYRECTECADYRDYARCLKRKRYATLPTYAEGLIRIINLYQLSKLDKVAPTMQ